MPDEKPTDDKDWSGWDWRKIEAALVGDVSAEGYTQINKLVASDPQSLWGAGHSLAAVRNALSSTIETLAKQRRDLIGGEAWTGAAATRFDELTGRIKAQFDANHLLLSRNRNYIELINVAGDALKLAIDAVIQINYWGAEATRQRYIDLLKAYEASTKTVAGPHGTVNVIRTGTKPKEPWFTNSKGEIVYTPSAYKDIDDDMTRQARVVLTRLATAYRDVNASLVYLKPTKNLPAAPPPNTPPPNTPPPPNLKPPPNSPDLKPPPDPKAPPDLKPPPDPSDVFKPPPEVKLPPTAPPPPILPPGGFVPPPVRPGGRVPPGKLPPGIPGLPGGSNRRSGLPGGSNLKAGLPGGSNIKAGLPGGGSLPGGGRSSGAPFAPPVRSGFPAAGVAPPGSPRAQDLMISGRGTPTPGGLGGMPYPPMGMGAGAPGGKQDEEERERTTWLQEDRDIWGVGTDVAPGVIRGGDPDAYEEPEYVVEPFATAPDETGATQTAPAQHYYQTGR
ncbi:hypothetical protein EV385_5393 [Krasilnikovia cinnamomea]|uniref:Uncharacterized protein n=1 Tax=Krasilnikovia cinnamomea TaxID=349313 RepID=A0A4V2G7Q9_9ACTN|nr:hypothetical protein [Krasilnikovia cinnamomea]RZU53466.1 hypothetical protein EV385_5393 [Krasilnikovia cinnamomea]